MAGIFTKIIRAGVVTGVVSGVLVGGTLLIAGPQRTHAIFSQLQDQVVERIDGNLEDPVAMRTQLRELSKEYPKRISTLRGDLAELQTQIRQLERDQEVSERVVALTGRDLDDLAPLLASARGEGGAQLASSRSDNYAVAHATTRARQIRQTRAAYSNRAAEAAHDLVYLRQQEARMAEVQTQLQAEYEQFQTQLTQLERQVDAIERNDRLIELLEDRQQRIDEMSRFEAASLEHVVSRLSELRSRQEAELQLLSTDQRRVDYESMAKMEIEDEASADTEVTGDAVMIR